METTIYKITFGAGSTSNYRGSIIKIECNETEKSFKWSHNLIKKSQLMKADSMFRNESPGSIVFYTYCREQDIEEAKNMLFDASIRLLEKFELQVSNLRKSLLKEF